MADKIGIDDFEAFVNDTEEVSNVLERGANDVGELSGNTDYLNTGVETINSSLGNLNKVKVSPIVTSSLDSLYKGVDELVYSYRTQVGKIVYGQQLAVDLIGVYKSGDGTTADEIYKIYGDVMKGLTDTGVFWLASAALKNQTYLSGLSKLFTYETDGLYSGGDFIVGDGVNSTLEFLAGDPGIEGLVGFMAKKGLGTVAVAAYEVGKGRLTYDDDTDDGRNNFRMGFDTFKGATNYLVWCGVSEAVSNSVGAALGSPGGPLGSVAGAAVATGVTMLTSQVFDFVKGQVTGDIIIDTFTGKDGEEHSVPRNGTGEKGSYAVLVDNYSNVIPNRYVNGVEYSESNYKRELYTNLDNVTGNVRKLYTDTEYNNFKQDLEVLKGMDSQEEANAYIANMKKTYSVAPARVNEMMDLYPALEKLDFDLDEYYQYYHPSTNSNS